MKYRFALWLAFAGMALNALWPLLANAGPRQFWAPMCSMVGTMSAPANVDGGPAQPGPGKWVAPHCPFCLGAGDQTPALAADTTREIAVASVCMRSLATVRTPPLALLYLRPDSRGPPGSS